MSNSLQAYLVHATPKAVEDLTKAFLLLPDDKRNWSPMGDARTALDQVAEVAILNGSTATLIGTRKWGDGDMANFVSEKAALVASGWDAVKPLFDESTKRVVAAVRDLGDEDLPEEVMMPWGAMTMAQIAAYPYWNTCYHEGQINYMLSMLGLLK